MISAVVAVASASGQTTNRNSAQKISLLDSVMIKFQNDNRAFEEYILLGRIECYSNVAGLEDIIDGKSELYFAILTAFTILENYIIFAA